MQPLYIVATTGEQNFALYRSRRGFIERWPYLGLICTKKVHLGLSEVAFTEGCPHVRGGHYEEFHCIPYKCLYFQGFLQYNMNAYCGPYIFLILQTQTVLISKILVKPPIKDTPKEDKPPNKGQAESAPVYTLYRKSPLKEDNLSTKDKLKVLL